MIMVPVENINSSKLNCLLAQKIIFDYQTIERTCTQKISMLVLLKAEKVYQKS